MDKSDIEKFIKNNLDIYIDYNSGTGQLKVTLGIGENKFVSDSVLISSRSIKNDNMED